MIRSLTLASAVFLSCGVNAASAQQTPTAQTGEVNIAACQSMDDCMITQSTCGQWVAINKNTEAFYEQFMSVMRANAPCDPNTIAPTRPEETRCVNNECQIKGQKAEE